MLKRGLYAAVAAIGGEERIEKHSQASLRALDEQALPSESERELGKKSRRAKRSRRFAA
jgi:hypothetical protein